MTTTGINDRNKYNHIKVGDFIVKYNTALANKAGRIAKIRKWNGNTMTVSLSNGGEFVISKGYPTEYDIFPTEGN